ncbi:unnamed protein product [Ceutorhynchus assimilis]|uniref:lysozyme n=1 Tax=Ceutorhynchus assimilis TaxID=467358 RepID=A0A9N9MGA2_9CUCU|nr:unnamed protein product [Ceutorhynchus assimilis]
MVLARGSIILLLLTVINVDAKIYERCELARELRNFDLPEDEVPTWICIAEHESNFDTGAMNLGSGDHGLFQISEIYWCSPPGYGCNSPCSKFRDENIADDLQCIRRIYNEHTRISGNGFDAWVVYPLHCKNITYDFIQDCFDENAPYNSTTDNEISTDEDLNGDGYNFPALPNKDDGDGYEFPKLPTREQKALLPFYKIYYEFPKFPADKDSIHHSVSAYNDIKTNPFLSGKIAARGSIHDSISVGEYLTKSISNNIKTNPFLNGKFSISKTSIYDSVSLKSNPFLNSHKQYDIDFDIESTSDNEIEVSTMSTSKEHVSRPEIPKPIQGNLFLTEYSTATSSTKSQIFTSRTSSRTKSPTSSTSDKNTKSSVPFKTSTVSSSFFTRPPLSTTHKAPTTVFQSKVTSRTQKSGSFAVASRHLNSSAIYTTTSKPSTSSSTTRKASTTIVNLQPFTKTSRTSTNFHINAKISTTTTKSSISTTAKPAYHSSSSTTSRKQFGSFTRTTTADLEAASSTFTPRFTTPKPFYSNSATTVNPSERQVTFAPDSWFSWLFSTQTLPPLVAPPRPGSRPEGSGPSPLRPTGGPFNSSTTRRPLPRPTHLLPGNSSTTRRPLPRPTHLLPGNYSTTRRPLPRPTHLLPGNYSTTRRPLPRPTHHLQPGSFSTPKKPTHLQPGSSTTVVEFITTRSSSPNVDRVTRRPMRWQQRPHPPRRHPVQLRSDEDGYEEVPIDEHVVYLRSKYGFQLFRV